jgi:hypothetical protein
MKVLVYDNSFLYLWRVSWDYILSDILYCTYSFSIG